MREEFDIPGVCIYTNPVYRDTRGYFLESFRANSMGTFVQDNESGSNYKVLRGLHFQKKHPQDKLVRVIIGQIFDVVVDIRPDSPAFGTWLGFYLVGQWGEKTHRSLFVPAGCAHGFLVVSPFAVVQYKCGEYYHPEDQCGIIWNDPDLNITWDKYCPPKEVIVSDQDNSWPSWAHVKEELINARKPDQKLEVP